MSSVFSSGESIQQLIQNTHEAVELYLETTNKEVPEITFELVMDIQEFFKANEFINVSRLADRIGMNASLLRQYSKGIKYPSLKQVSKIENEIKQIGIELTKTQLQPAN